VRTTLLIFFLFFLIPLFNGQNVSLSGTIRDGANGETVAGATILLKPVNKAAASNAYGFYSISVPPGNYTAVVSYLGYRNEEIAVELKASKSLNVQMKSEAADIEEVEIKTKLEANNIESTQMSAVHLQMNEIKKVPAFMGEVDILKTIQLLPGIKNAGDGNTGFYVRGGGPDQNLILLDEAPIYNASHLLGFFSVFNGDAVKDVTLHKGNMPAQYGGRLSSVLDISMKEGNNQRFEVDGGIGVIASRLTVQGPIKKGRSSFIVSARRTYVDVVARPWIQKSDFRGTSYYFYDLNGKLNFTLGDKDRLFISGYYGKDKFIYSDVEGGFNTDIPWGNASACLRWNHIFNPKLFANTSLVFTNYDFSFGATQQDFRLVINSGIKDYTAKYDLSYFPNSKHAIKTGVHYTFHTFVPTSVSAQQGSTVFDLGKKIMLYAHDPAIYISDDWDVSPLLKVNVGLRFSNFAQVGPFSRYKKDAFGKISDTVFYRSGQTVAYYNGLEPRLSARYKLGSRSSLKASYARNFQYIHLASISSVSLPTDIWMPCTEVIKPQESNQYALGIFRNMRDNTYEASIEGYYKTMSNQVEFAEGAQPTDNIYDNPDNAFTFGRGWAYGAEFFVRKNSGRLTGWIGYTLSWTWRQFEAINYGQKFLAKYDRRHDVSFVCNYTANKKITLGLVWVYGSGNRGTLPNGFFLYEGSLSNDYGLRNSYQFIPYHRMDFNLTFTPEGRKKTNSNSSDDVKRRRFHQSFTLSIFNVYNRYNPYFIYLTRQGDFTEGTLKIGAKQVSLFPILPTITWNFRF
jgi:hypothetical protein